MVAALRIQALLGVMVAFAPGCGREHCDWSRVDDVVELEGAASLGGYAFDATDLSLWVGDGLFISTNPPAGSDAAAWTLSVDDYPTEPGSHPVVARVAVFPAGTSGAERRWELEVAGVLDVVSYRETSETNPIDAYTSGGTVTARDLEGSLTVDDGENIATLDFAIEQSLEESCFLCEGIEGCNF